MEVFFNTSTGGHMEYNKSVTTALDWDLEILGLDSNGAGGLLSYTKNLSIQGTSQFQFRSRSVGRRSNQLRE